MIIIRDNEIVYHVADRGPYFNTHPYFKVQNGDIIGENKKLDFNENDKMTFFLCEAPQSDLKELTINYVTINSIIISCYEKEPIYWGLPKTKGYEYKVSVVIKGKTDEKIEYSFTFKDELKFFFNTIINLINSYIEEGYSLDELDFEYLDWQCNTWESCAANGQGRRLSYFEESRLSDLYDYIETMDIKIYEDGINRPGKDDMFWEEIFITFKFKDKYIRELISKALNVSFTVENDICTYKITTRSHYAYSVARRVLLSENVANRYKKDYIKSLRISTIRNYNSSELIMRNMRK